MSEESQKTGQPKTQLDSYLTHRLEVIDQDDTRLKRELQQIDYYRANPDQIPTTPQNLTDDSSGPTSNYCLTTAANLTTEILLSARPIPRTAAVMRHSQNANFVSCYCIDQRIREVLLYVAPSSSSAPWCTKCRMLQKPMIHCSNSPKKD